MSQLYVGKFKLGDQLEKNYYRVDTEDQELCQIQWNGLSVGDYVIPIQNAMVPKLFRVRAFETVDKGTEVKFDVVKTFHPPLAFSNVCFCKYLQPDINLVNKAAKSTKGVGFHPLQTEPDCPEITAVDFETDRRRYYVCLEKKLQYRAFFQPFDICIVISDAPERRIKDIVEFNGKVFHRYDPLWNLYLEKVKESGGKNYTLRQLYEFAAPEHDGAKLKEGYLRSILEGLDEEEFFSVDNLVSLYDNMIVGRLRSQRRRSQQDHTDAAGAKAHGEDEEIDLGELTAYQQYAKLMEFNPNMILYGPPGTGKTYGANKIIEAFEQLYGEKESYAQLKKDGRVKFITFHQAFSYEEFIEGIRPRIDEETGALSYPVESGVLKEIADACRIQKKKKDIKGDLLSNTTPRSRVWKVSLGRRTQDEEIYKTLRDRGEMAIKYGPEQDVTGWEDSEIDQYDPTGMLKKLCNKVQLGDIVFVLNSTRTIRLIGVVTGEYFYTKRDGFGYRHRRKVSWLMNCEESPIDIFELNHGKQLTLSSLYELKIPVSDAVGLIDTEQIKEVMPKPYYLVIDEINRGNIAKIFGELITLIEKDKRESLSCVLPYSRTTFTVPKNLYLIGTMNTSDRSIALLDTALRRRFVFVEMNPDVLLLERENPTIGGHVSPAKLLQEMNRKIMENLDRDHRIGHSYFLGKDLVTKYDLYNVWYYKVLPLLLEYFYYDSKQVEKIIGSRFFDQATGELRYLDLKANANGISEFESALMKIYL